MAKPRVALLFGGMAEEHPISVKSAQEVARHLDNEKYEAHWVGITTDGTWWWCETPEEGWENNGRPVTLAPDPSVRGLITRDSDTGISPVTVPIDVVFPVLHGRYGEDGAIQGLLELSGIPFVGCGLQTSVLCMDKSLTYLVAESAGIATPTRRVVMDSDKVSPDGLTFPVFVKPARSGSSFGVSKVATADELPEAIAAARQYDPKVIIEEAVDGHEVGCAVLGERFGLVVGEVDRVELTHGFFRIHQESTPEQGSENSQFIVPADISPEARLLVQETAKRLYTALGCQGLARVDLFLLHDGTVVLNEVNTLPGLTSYSRYPRMMAAAGLPLGEVIDRLIALTLLGKKR